MKNNSRTYHTQRRFGKKLQAFTLVELVVVLIITGVCSWLAFSVFLNVNGYYRSLNAKIDEQIEIETFRSAIEYDLYLSDSILQRKDTIILKKDTANIYYIARDSLLVRITHGQTHQLNVWLRSLALVKEKKVIRSILLDDSLSFDTGIPPWVGMAE